MSLNSAGVSLVGWGLGTGLVSHMHESGCSCFDHVTELLTKLREVFRNNLRKTWNGEKLVFTLLTPCISVVYV